jgi:hypothetical protein
MSDWLLSNVQWVIFQLYIDENKLLFDEMMTPFLYYTKMLRWVFIGPAHWNNSPQIQRRRYTHENKFIIFGLILLGIDLAIYHTQAPKIWSCLYSDSQHVHQFQHHNHLSPQEIEHKNTTACYVGNPGLVYNYY